MAKIKLLCGALGLSFALYMVLLFLIVLFTSCQHCPEVKPPPEPVVVYTIDSSQLIAARKSYDSAMAELRMSIQKQNMAYDSIRNELILANYRIERVRYYVGICIRKPSQKKFLLGWTRRAVGM